MEHATMEAPPEGVLTGESIPRENAVGGQEIYEKLKEQRIETLERHKELSRGSDLVGGGE